MIHSSRKGRRTLTVLCVPCPCNYTYHLDQIKIFVFLWKVNLEIKGEMANIF